MLGHDRKERLALILRYTLKVVALDDRLAVATTEMVGIAVRTFPINSQYFQSQ